MTFRKGVVVGLLAVVIVALLAVGAMANGPVTLRTVVGVCAVALLGAGALYALDGYTMQAIGHVVAGIGLIVAATVGEGTAVWVGIVITGGGGLLLLRDAFRRGRRGRPSV